MSNPTETDHASLMQSIRKHHDELAAEFRRVRQRLDLSQSEPGDSERLAEIKQQLGEIHDLGRH